MKAGIRTTTAALMVAVLALLMTTMAFVYGQMKDRISLIAANDNERILNSLFAGLRDYENFGSAIEADSTLSNRVAGIAVYLADGKSLYAWGGAPESVTPARIASWRDSAGPSGRFVLPHRAARTFSFLLRASRMSPPPPPGKPSPETGSGKPSFFFDTLGKGDWVYLEIRHPDYWNALLAMNVLFPLAAILFIAFMFYVRRLVIRNVEYRESIEKQKNLVVLGTAASTLAHEIKNPLLAIRLQTSIIKKMYPDIGVEELANIDTETDRLSELTFRINDYLREPRGAPSSVDVLSFARGESLSLLGRDSVCGEGGGPCVVLADPERLRSAFANILRNAVESGGTEAEVSIRVREKDGFVEAEILDRGRGIAAGDRSRLFEPFFTTKSRGTGIGLAVSQRFIQAAGGTVSLSPRDGGGTSALIRLPKHPGEGKK